VCGPILPPQPVTAAICNFLNCRLYIFIRGNLLAHNPPANPNRRLAWKHFCKVYALLLVNSPNIRNENDCIVQGVQPSTEPDIWQVYNITWAYNLPCAMVGVGPRSNLTRARHLVERRLTFLTRKWRFCTPDKTVAVSLAACTIVAFTVTLSFQKS